MVASHLEVEWDEVERGWMVALHEYRAGLCPRCGNDPAFCQDPDFDVKFEVKPTPSRCYVLTAVDRFQEAQEQTGLLVQHPKALMYGIRPKTF